MGIFPSLQILTYFAICNLGDYLSADCHSRIDMLKRSLSTYSLSTFPVCLTERVCTGSARGSVSTSPRVSTHFLQGLSPRRVHSKGILPPKSSHKCYFSTIYPLPKQGQALLFRREDLDVLHLRLKLRFAKRPRKKNRVRFAAPTDVYLAWNWHPEC